MNLRWINTVLDGERTIEQEKIKEENMVTVKNRKRKGGGHAEEHAAEREVEPVVRKKT